MPHKITSATEHSSATVLAPLRGMFSVRDPIAWLSELYSEREYIKSSIEALEILQAHNKTP